MTQACGSGGLSAWKARGKRPAGELNAGARRHPAVTLQPPSPAAGELTAGEHTAHAVSAGQVGPWMGRNERTDGALQLAREHLITGKRQVTSLQPICRQVPAALSPGRAAPPLKDRATGARARAAHLFELHYVRVHERPVVLDFPLHIFRDLRRQAETAPHVQSGTCSPPVTRLPFCRGHKSLERFQARQVLPRPRIDAP